MYIVKFIRADKMPVEEYYYNTIEEARWHLDLFHNDDSGLYVRIEIVNENALDKPIEATSFA